MNAALKLYEISNQFQALEQLGDSDDLPAEVIADTLEALEGDFEMKAVQVAKFILSLEANALAVENAARAMGARSTRIYARAQSIKAYLQFHMQALEKKRIEVPDLVITRRANPPAVLITNEHAIPAQFWVDPPPPPKRLDKKAIKAALDAGERVEGAYVEAGERLEIKQ
jgi:Siphovirus Gp157